MGLTQEGCVSTSQQLVENVKTSLPSVLHDDSGLENKNVHVQFVGLVFAHQGVGHKHTVFWPFVWPHNIRSISRVLVPSNVDFEKKKLYFSRLVGNVSQTTRPETCKAELQFSLDLYTKHCDRRWAYLLFLTNLQSKKRKKGKLEREMKFPFWHQAHVTESTERRYLSSNGIKSFRVKYFIFMRNLVFMTFLFLTSGSDLFMQY